MSNLTPNQNLLLEYDKLFNETNTKYNKKNRELKTKNKLLEINQKSNLAKMETIKILQYIFGFLLLTAVVVWMHLSFEEDLKRMFLKQYLQLQWWLHCTAYIL